MGFSELCRYFQINPIHLLNEANLSPSILRSADIKIPYDCFIRVLSLAAGASEQHLFGLILSQRVGIESLGPLGLLASQCNTLAESLSVIQKHTHFHGQGIHLNLEVDGEEACFVYDAAMGGEGVIQLIELGVGRARNVIQGLAPQGMNISQISFKHEPLAPPAEYEAVLKVKTRFRERVNAVTFPARFLSQSPADASERVRRYFEAFLADAGKDHEHPLAQQVLRLIYELIPTGEATASNVARLLGKHIRMLQKELQATDTDFSSLLEQARYRMACEALSQETISITNLALQLGYSELSSFSRAFKRWSGVSPQQWLQRMNQGHPASR